MALVVILAVGSDSLILETRASVLRLAGYLVDIVPSVKHAIDRFRNGDYDLVIVCHTIPPREIDQLVDSIRGLGAHTPIMTVAPLSDSSTSRFPDTVLDSNPEKLLAGVEAILQRSAVLR